MRFLQRQGSTEADIVSRYAERHLPHGFMALISHLPHDTTPEEISEFLTSHNLPVSADRISIRNYNDGASCKVSFPPEVVAAVLNWALDGAKLRGDEEIVAKPLLRKMPR